jgi:hypothetical protein
MSAGADPQAAKSIQTSLKDLMKSLRRYEEFRKSSVSSLESINSTQRMVVGEEKLTPTGQAKLLKQYQEVGAPVLVGCNISWLSGQLGN